MVVKTQISLLSMPPLWGRLAVPIRGRGFPFKLSAASLQPGHFIQAHLQIVNLKLGSVGRRFGGAPFEPDKVLWC
jgi:hypothetical protein